MPKRQRQTLASLLFLSAPIISHVDASVVATTMKRQTRRLSKRQTTTQMHQLRGGQLKGNGFQSDLTESAKNRSLACTSNEWHIDFTKQSGNWCSNSLSYPPSVKNNPGMLHSTAEACCNHFFAGRGCQVNRVCDVGEVKPTMRPSGRPTSRPTEPLVQYYSIPSSGLCAPVSSKTPSWITDYYTDYSACCKVGWVYDQCIEEAPPGALKSTSTTSTSTTVPIIEFYAVPTSGICIEKDEKTPNWMDESYFFQDYEECCKSSWNEEQCLKEKPDWLPTQSPTDMPTLQPTEQPSVGPSLSPNRGPTLRPSDMPTVEPTLVPTGVNYSSSKLVDLVNYKSSCTAAKWHPTPDFSKCTNSFEYNEEWDTPPASETYLHTMLSGCCEAFFEVWNKECIFEDICTTSPTETPSTHPTNAPSTHPTTMSPTSHPTTSSPTTKPTNAPTVTPIKYYSIYSTGICTPIDAFTPYWLTDADLFEDYTECCNGSWNKDACHAARPEGACCTSSPTAPTSSPSFRPTVQSSTSPTTAPIQGIKESNMVYMSENCNSGLWHPSSDYSSCTNSLVYPNSWNDSPYKQTFLHNTREGCCRVFFESWGRDCRVEDVCDGDIVTSSTESTIQVTSSTDSTMHTTTSTEYTGYNLCLSAKWHPSEDYSTCTNSFGYDDAWNYEPMKNSYLHEHVENCCHLFFEAWQAECVVDDICDVR